MKILMNPLMLCAGVALVGLSLTSCSGGGGGGGGESGENGDFSQEDSSGATAPSKLAVGQRITFNLPSGTPGFNLVETFTISSATQARQGSFIVNYQYKKTGRSTAQFVSKSVSGELATVLTYELKFQSPSSGAVTERKQTISAGTTPAPLPSMKGGTFEIN